MEMTVPDPPRPLMAYLIIAHEFLEKQIGLGGAIAVVKQPAVLAQLDKVLIRLRVKWEQRRMSRAEPLHESIDGHDVDFPMALRWGKAINWTELS